MNYYLEKWKRLPTIEKCMITPGLLVVMPLLAVAMIPVWIFAAVIATYIFVFED